MTDREITRLCAEAMGLWFGHSKSDDTDNLYVSSTGIAGPWVVYDPLHDDAQAMQLVKKFQLAVYWIPDAEGGWAASYDFGPSVSACDADLNRAICECCARMQLDKSK